VAVLAICICAAFVIGIAMVGPRPREAESPTGPVAGIDG
jgi:hypothetical protein